MPAGTITLTNNSAGVNGSGTSFTAELKANDFIVAVVGGVTYTLGVKSVDSATGLTLITAYNGPTVSGVAWTAVPNAALVGITAQVAADVAKAIRGLNMDKDNWQQVYSGSGNITVSLPDGSQYTGPSWPSLVSSLAGKVAKSGDTLTGTLQSSSTGFGIRKTAAGWSNNTNQMGLATGGDGISVAWTDFIYGSNYWAHRIVVNVNGGASGVWEFRQDGSIRSSGSVYAAGTQLTSDKRLKSNFEDVNYTIDDIDKIVPHYYDKASPSTGNTPQIQLPDNEEDVEAPVADIEPIPVSEEKVRELGVVAQELREMLPVLVTESYYNEKYPDLLSVNYSGLTAWLVGYCKLLKDRIIKQDEVIAELQKRMKAMDGLDA